MIPSTARRLVSERLQERVFDWKEVRTLVTNLSAGRNAASGAAKELRQSAVTPKTLGISALVTPFYRERDVWTYLRRLDEGGTINLTLYGISSMDDVYEMRLAEKWSASSGPRSYAVQFRGGEDPIVYRRGHLPDQDHQNEPR